MADQPASSALQQAQDQKLGQISAILQSSMTEEQKSAYAIKKEQEITNKQLKKQVTHDNWMMKWTKDQAKKALAMASKLKIDDIAKNMTEKASKFAGNLLDLLMKGLGLAALWKLLDWIATQDWVALYNEHKKTDFYMSHKPSNMRSRQFLAMMVDLIMKFCVDPYLQSWPLTNISKIL